MTIKCQVGVEYMDLKRMFSMTMSEILTSSVEIIRSGCRYLTGVTDNSPAQDNTYSVCLVSSFRQLNRDFVGGTGV